MSSLPSPRGGTARSRRRRGAPTVADLDQTQLGAPAPAPAPAGPNPDQTWKLLLLVVDGAKQADVKGAGSLERRTPGSCGNA